MTSLNLRNNNTRSEGAIAVAKALEVNAVLTKLDLTYNDLEDVDMQLVRDAVSGRDGFALLV